MRAGKPATVIQTPRRAPLHQKVPLQFGPASEVVEVAQGAAWMAMPDCTGTGQAVNLAV
jgi:hypothetical protein